MLSTSVKFMSSVVLCSLVRYAKSLSVPYNDLFPCMYGKTSDITNFPWRHLMGTKWVVLPLQKVFTWLSWVESQESSLPRAHLTQVRASQPGCARARFSSPLSYWQFDLRILAMPCPLCFSFPPAYVSKEQLKHSGYCFSLLWPGNAFAVSFGVGPGWLFVGGQVFFWVSDPPSHILSVLSHT